MRDNQATHRAGQSAIELAVVTAALAAALVAMSVYVKRGISGKLHDSADQIGDQYDPQGATGSTTVTETGRTRTRSTMRRDSARQLDVMETVTTIEEPQVQTRTGNESVGPLNSSLW